MNGDLAELLNAAETDGVRGVEEILKDDEFVDAHRAKCVKARREMCSVLAVYTISEALTIMRTVTERSMDNFIKKLRLKNMERMFRVQRE